MDEGRAAGRDVEANRRQTKYSRADQLRRVLWSVGRLAFAAVPRPLYGLRAAILRLHGARVGRHCQIYPTVRIFAPWQLEIGDWSAVGDRVILYNLGAIRIGCRVTISQNAHLCAGTHDHHDPAMPLIRARIAVEDDAWVCADAFVGPDVVVGQAAVVGARAVVMRSVAPRAVVAGNPARPIGRRPNPGGT
ncbi:MAG: putative colanic acid biosynthesis acetyltransferase [Alphaproteobacteria bacterium]|nr:putative colanic acid biosynthesis acetyltransferase [Alphaproteobacteria bacterium]